MDNQTRCRIGAAVILRVEQLEGRSLMVGSPWPLAPTDGITTTYGQFVSQGGLHFHAGVDIIALPNVDVTAIENGTVFAVDSTHVNQDRRYITVNSGKNKGWNYTHMNPGINPKTGAVFVVGNPVNDTAPNNKIMGKVVGQPAGSKYPSHLHIEYGKDADPTLPAYFRPTTDPLDRLDPTILNDTIEPEVGLISFRLGTDDNGGATVTETHHYMMDLDPTGAIIVGARSNSYDKDNNAAAGGSAIDIIAGATDLVKLGGEKVGIKSIGVKAVGQMLGKSFEVAKSFDFTGEFTRDPAHGGVQTAGSLHDVSLVRTVYEYDVQNHSRDLINYYYIVTNTT